MAYRFESKPKTITFGPYPEVTLAQAREKREEVKSKLRENIYPMESRKENNNDALKFKEASEQYWEGRQDISASYKKNATSTLEMHLFPKLGDKPIASLDYDALLPRRIKLWSRWKISLDCMPLSCRARRLNARDLFCKTANYK